MPIVNGLEINYSNQLAIQRINALEGDGPAIMEAYNIIGHPIILLVDKNGKEVQRFIGPQPVQTLDTAIKQLLATDPNNEITLDSLQNKPNKIPPIPTLQPTLIAEGKDLHAIHCAECHGPNGEGEENWKIPNEDGSYPAPPHNGTGHTWHHADSLLFDIVANGSSIQKTTMPAFGKQLSDAEILAILEYIKEWWGPEERAFQWQITWQSLPENNK